MIVFFAIGDCAALTQPNGKLVPPRAQAAHQMAKACAKNIFALFEQKPLKAFKYNDKGTLVSLSSFTALGSISNKFGKIHLPFKVNLHNLPMCPYIECINMLYMVALKLD